MGKRNAVVLVGVLIVLSMVVAFVSAQTFEEALWGPAESPPSLEDDLCDDPGEIPCDDPCEDPGDDPAGDAGATDTVQATASSLDLGIEGTTEETEDDPGAFLAAGGRRARLTLIVLPDMVGPVTLAVTSGADKVDLYADEEGGEPFGDTLTYRTAAEMPATLYLQAVAGSEGCGDVVIALSSP